MKTGIRGPRVGDHVGRGGQQLVPEKKNLEKVSLQMLIYKGGRYGFYRFIFKILLFASLPG